MQVKTSRENHESNNDVLRVRRVEVDLSFAASSEGKKRERRERWTTVSDTKIYLFICIELKKRRESQVYIYWIDGYFDCPYICVWFPRESHRYSRRFPAFYVFGSLERVIDTPAGFPSFMYCQLSDNDQRGHLPRVNLERLQRVSPY